VPAPWLTRGDSPGRCAAAARPVRGGRAVGRAGGPAACYQERRVPPTAN